jgi:outer membrane receptor protein involved in Fe transport
MIQSIAKTRRSSRGTLRKAARNRPSKLPFILFASVANLVVPLGNAQAQDAEQKPSQTAGGADLVRMPQHANEEIIVTARKREEAAIAVPVVENVLTSETIERAAITNLRDVARFAPGLTIGQNTLSIGAQISIRGYGTSASDPGVDQSVSLNIDGMTFTQGLAFESGFFDLQQIEVLKGPQSLFFGKSSPGGVIAMRTADPGPNGEIIARAGYEFEAREYRGELILSTPVMNGFGVRFAGQYWDRDGFFENKALALPGTGAQDPKYRLGGGHGGQARATVLFEPSSQFDARLKVNYVYDYDQYSGMVELAYCPEGVAPSPGNPFPPTLNPADNCKLDRTIYYVDLSHAGFPTMASAGAPRLSDKTQVYGTLEMNYRPITSLTLTSVTGYYNLDSNNVGANAFFTGYSGSPLGLDSLYNRDEFTQEVRANSDFKGPLNFTIGAFYQNADVVLLQTTYANQQLLPFLPPLLASQRSKMDIESISGFGQLRYHPIEKLELAAGGRYTHEERKEQILDALTGIPIPVVTPKITSDTFSPEVTITYRPTDDLTAFASYKKGYKSGSFSLARLDAPAGGLPDNSFGDEKIEGGEAGIKSRFFGRQLSVNLAGYYYDIKGLQAGTSQANEASNGLPLERTINAASGRSYGIDLDASYRPDALKGLDLYAALNWNKTKFTDFNNVPCYGGQTIALGCNQQFNPATGLFTAQDVTGKPFVRAPEWQISFGAVYDIPLPSGWTLTVANDNFYSSSYYTTLGLRDAFIQGDYFKLGGSLAVKSPNDRWELALIGKNLTNKITTGFCGNSNFANNFFGAQQITGGTTSGPDGVDELMCSPDPGRSIWLRLTFRPML